jgi:hypothetical protein
MPHGPVRDRASKSRILGGPLSASRPVYRWAHQVPGTPGASPTHAHASSLRYARSLGSAQHESGRVASIRSLRCRSRASGVERYMLVRMLALSSATVLLSWDVSEACKCAPERTAVEALAMADAGFIGTVVERRLSLRRLSRCAPSFRVGETSLIYAGREKGRLVVLNCIRPKRIAEGTPDLVQLGAPMVTFPGQAQPVATSFPFSRWMRAHIVAGTAVYALTYINREWASPTADMILLTATAVLLVVAAAVSFVRRRWRLGSGLLAAAFLTLVANIFWIGHVFLRSDWSAPYLRW